MNASHTNSRSGKLIYPELSYTVVGICFEVHNQIGRFAREKQCCDFIEKKLVEAKIPYQREYRIGKMGNQVDFLIDNKVVLEVKAKHLISREDFYQLQCHLSVLGQKTWSDGKF